MTSNVSKKANVMLYKDNLNSKEKKYREISTYKKRDISTYKKWIKNI